MMVSANSVVSLLFGYSRMLCAVRLHCRVLTWPISSCSFEIRDSAPSMLTIGYAIQHKHLRAIVRALLAELVAISSA